MRTRSSPGTVHPALTRTRGLDLSGSLEGAGGIGGLLARTAHQSTSPYQPSTSAYYHADGNGNVTYLLNQARTHGASYRYDPYGRLIASSGTLAGANLMRFSSKPWHDHSETYYYGYRFYLPEGQRWINRDPIGERGGINIYTFSANSPVSRIDPFGLTIVSLYPIWDTNVKIEHPLNCARKIFTEVKNDYCGGSKQAPDDYSCREAHCIANCRITRECPWGSFTAWGTSLYKELYHNSQEYSPQIHSPLTWVSRWNDMDSPGDMKSNRLGRIYGRSKCPKTCEEMCKGVR